MSRLFLLAFLVTLFPLTATAQNLTENDLLSVSLDCRNCNGSFIRSEISFINFVRDQSDANVHLVITSQGTASGGEQFTLDFIGQQEMSPLSNILLLTTYDSDTEIEQRNALVKHVKLGLVPFLLKNSSLTDFDLTYQPNSGPIINREDADKWRNWVFEVGANTWFSGEESQSDLNVNGRFRARKTTEDLKIRLNLDENYSRETFRNTDDSTGVETEEIFEVSRRSAFGLLAFSLGDHWSIGSYFSAGSSSRDNIDFRIGATPSIEYSFYPYREFARREVTLRYGVYTSYFDYTEQTIFGETEEILTRQELDFRMIYTKPWGEFEGRINGRTYLHDFSKNRLFFDLELDMRIVRGVELSINTFYSIINDQLSLSAGGVTDKELIANTRQQATSFSFGGSVGIEVTFGSIFDNIVNTRF